MPAHPLARMAKARFVMRMPTRSLVKPFEHICLEMLLLVVLWGCSAPAPPPPQQHVLLPTPISAELLTTPATPIPDEPQPYASITPLPAAIATAQAAILAANTPVGARPEESILLAEMKINLLEPRLDPQVRSSIQEKIRFLEEDIMIRATGQVYEATHGIPTSVGTIAISTHTALDEGTPRPTEVGIIEARGWPWMGAWFSPTYNVWRGEDRGGWIRVYGGASSREPLRIRANVFDAQGQAVSLVKGAEQSIVVIWYEDDTRLTDIYVAPIQAGKLTIVGAEQGILTLQTADGQTLQFDIAGRKFMQ